MLRKYTMSYSQLSWLSSCAQCPWQSAASSCWAGPDHMGLHFHSVLHWHVHWAAVASGFWRWSGNSPGSRERGPGPLLSVHWRSLNWTRRWQAETNWLLPVRQCNSLTASCSDQWLTYGWTIKEKPERKRALRLQGELIRTHQQGWVVFTTL